MELFSIRIQRTFQLVSTGLERMQKTTGQTASMAHSENMVSRLSTHRKKPLQFLLKK